MSSNRQILVYKTTPGAGQVASGAVNPLDFTTTAVGIGFVCKVSGTVNYSVEHTYDNVLDPAVSPTWLPHGVSNMTNATTTQESNFVIPVSGMRVVINSGGGTVTLVVLNQGRV